MKFQPGPGWRDGIDGATWAPSASRDALRLRAWANRLIREFFHARNVLEVETPVLSLAGNTEPNIASFSLEFSGRNDGAPRTRWLRTSPEYALKRLLAAGVGDCYELGRVFRDGEAGGRHNPEFTMLEWYRVGWDHLRLIDETAELVRAALSLLGRDATLRVVCYRELYLGPIELANGYHELQDAIEQGARFSRDGDVRRGRHDPLPPVDAHLLAALQAGLPACAGVALGVDRLLMAMLETSRIADVLAFDFPRA